MVFNSLNGDLQNLLLTNYEYLSKWFIFIFVIFISVYYIGNFKNLKPTKFIVVAIFRLIYVGVSYIILFTSPLQFLLMTPSYSFYSFYSIYLNLYYVFVIMFMFMVFFDLLRYGLLGILRLAGLDLGDNNVSELVNGFYNYKDFKKIAGRGK